MLCICWHSCWLSPLALRMVLCGMHTLIDRLVDWSFIRSIEAMKFVTLTMLSQFFNLAWIVNANEQCYLPASTFCVLLLFLMLYCCCWKSLTPSLLLPFYFCFFRLQVEVLSDHSLFLYFYTAQRFCLNTKVTNLYTVHNSHR